MNDGVRILIERMKTNPEDFEYGGKFAWVADSLDSICTKQGPGFWFLKDEDRDVLVQAWKDVYSGKFTDQVMKTLFDEGFEERKKMEQQHKLQQQQIAQSLAKQFHGGMGAQGAQQASGSASGLFGLGGLGRFGLGGLGSIFK